MNVQLWLTYYGLNATAPRRIPWDLGADLPPEEARFVVPSLQEFQLGESSEGGRLRAAASAWAGRRGDSDFPRLIDLFIAEEQRHAAELARYLRLNGHPVRARAAADAVFRLLRHLTGRLEVAMSVLLTAEIIGFVYYRALREATRSALLRSLCDTFLLDEAAHLLFHMEQLSRMSQGLPHPARGLARRLSWLLMAGACAIVWARHRAVLKRGGLSFGTFAGGCLARLAFVTQAARRGAWRRARRPQPAGSVG